MYFLMVPEYVEYTDNDYIMVRERTYKRLESARKALKSAPRHSYVLDTNRRVVAHTEEI